MAEALEAVERGDQAGLELLLELAVVSGRRPSAGGAGRRVMEYGKTDRRLPVLLSEALKCAVICWLWCKAWSSRSSAWRWAAVWDRMKIIGAAIGGKRLSRA